MAICPDHIRVLADAGVRRIDCYAINDGIAGRHRELPSTEPVLIINTGDPISVIDASGDQLAVGTGKAFFAGLHDRHCFSVSNGRQSGIHVRLSSAAAYSLLGPAAGECVNRAVLLDDILDKRTTVDLERFEKNSGSASFFAALSKTFAQGKQVEEKMSVALRQLSRPGARVPAWRVCWASAGKPCPRGSRHLRVLPR